MTVTGTGWDDWFERGETVAIQSQKGQWLSARPDATGAFSVQLTIDVNAAPGPSWVTAVYGNGSGASQNFTVTQGVVGGEQRQQGAPGGSAPAEQVSVAPDPVEAGQSITISGTGFHPGNSVIIEWCFRGPLADYPIVEEDGSFTLTVTVPLDAPVGESCVNMPSHGTYGLTISPQKTVSAPESQQQQQPGQIQQPPQGNQPHQPAQVQQPLPDGQGQPLPPSAEQPQGPSDPQRGVLGEQVTPQESKDPMSPYGLALPAPDLFPPIQGGQQSGQLRNGQSAPPVGNDPDEAEKQANPVMPKSTPEDGSGGFPLPDQNQMLRLRAIAVCLPAAVPASPLLLLGWSGVFLFGSITVVPCGPLAKGILEDPPRKHYNRPGGLINKGIEQIMRFFR